MDVLTEAAEHELCFFCREPVRRMAHQGQQDNTWKQVIGWVGGPKKDSMRMREDTGEYAHDECVQKVMSGMPPEQKDLFEEADS